MVGTANAPNKKNIQEFLMLSPRCQGSEHTNWICNLFPYTSSFTVCTQGQLRHDAAL